VLEGHKFLASLFACSGTPQTAPPLLQALSQKPRSGTVLNALAGYLLLLVLRLDPDQLNLLATSLAAYVNQLAPDFRDNLLMQLAVSVAMNRSDGLRRGCCFLARPFREKTYAASKEAQALLAQLLEQPDGLAPDSLVRVCPLVPFSCPLESFPETLRAILDRQHPSPRSRSDQRRPAKKSQQPQPDREPSAGLEEVEFVLSPKLSLPSRDASSPRRLSSSLRDRRLQSQESQLSTGPMKPRVTRSKKPKQQASESSQTVAIHQELLQRKQNSRRSQQALCSQVSPREHTFGLPAASSEDSSQEAASRRSQNHRHPGYPLDAEELAKHARIKQRFSRLSHLTPELASLVAAQQSPAAGSQPAFQSRLSNSPAIECLENFVLSAQSSELAKALEWLDSSRASPSQPRLLANVLDLCMYYLSARDGVFGPTVRQVLQAISEYITGRRL